MPEGKVAMTIAEVLLQDYDVEISNTRRTLERVTADTKDWVPHAKSMPMGRLAMHCAALPLFGLYAGVYDAGGVPAAAGRVRGEVPGRACCGE
jgi:hypothetical protein